MPSNPIQQRIELICEKWEEAKGHQQARIVRIECQADELDMVDTFFTYMIGADTPVLDIAFHFDTRFNDIRTFSRDLLKELWETIYVWNNSEKDKRIDFVPIQWLPDYAKENDKNPAALFVDNFNRLADEFDLEKNFFAVAIFKTAFFNKDIADWFSYAIKAQIHAAVKFLIHDTITEPLFKRMANDWPQVITTIPLNLDMPKAMEQTAAMGDPKDPSTAYRQTFIKMMNAMTASNEGEAEKWGRDCIEIATQNLARDPYWIMQLIVLYVALGNDKIRYKRKNETLDYANKAVETASAAQEYFESEMASTLLAQALMFRGTVCYVQSKFTEAFTDFSACYKLYLKQSNLHLAIESCRMGGRSALKEGLTKHAMELLTAGVRLGRMIDETTAKSSTYPGVLELLLDNNHLQYISVAEISDIAGNLYGKNWMKVVVNWRKASEPIFLQQQESASAIY